MKARTLALAGCSLVLLVAIWFGLSWDWKSNPASVSPAPQQTSPVPMAASGAPAPAIAPTTAPRLPLPAAPGTSAANPPLPAKRGGVRVATTPSALPDQASPAPVPFIPAVAPSALAGDAMAGRADLDKVDRMLVNYRTLIGENPIGTNAEIMKAIMGDNPKGAVLGPPDGMSLNGSGELIDQWGTPIFFHQISGTHMEIRSAGPDRKMWTSDDLILK